MACDTERNPSERKAVEEPQGKLYPDDGVYEKGQDPLGEYCALFDKFR